MLQRGFEFSAASSCARPARRDRVTPRARGSRNEHTAACSAADGPLPYTLCTRTTRHRPPASPVHAAHARLGAVERV